MKLKTVIKCSVLILGIIIIPLLYSFFYLGAFWDPYNSLKTLPVAVVNDDRGAVINGQSRNLGNEAVDELVKNGSLKFIRTNDSDARKGAEGTKYYAVITFPANFSSSIATASTPDKQVAQISYEANKKRNYIAAQIMKTAITQLEETARGNVDKELTSTLSSKLREVPGQLGTLNTGLKTLGTGADTLKNGSAQAAGGARSLYSGITSLDAGLSGASDGAKALGSGLDSLNGGLSRASAGAKQLAAATAQNLPALESGAAELNSGAKNLLAQLGKGPDASHPTVYDGVTGVDSGTASYVSAVDSTLYTMITSDPASPQLLAGYEQSLGQAEAAYAAATDPTAKVQYGEQIQMLSNLVTIYGVATDPSVTNESEFEAALVKAANSDPTKQSVVSSGAALKTGADGLASQFSDGGAFKAGVSQLAAGTAALAGKKADLDKLGANINELSSALAALQNGSSKAASGAKQLSGGLSSAKSGSAALASGGKALAAANGELSDGAGKLSDGISKAQKGVGDSIKTADNETKSLSGLDDYAKAPVSVKENNLDPVPNYGTAFAPYFMSLSLWVGALLMFFGIYLDADERIKVLSRHSDKKLVRVGAFALIGVAQAVVLALIVQFGLGLKVDNTGVFYSSCILISLVFISIVEFLIVNFKDVGKFLSIAFLVLQLTSCGGTFPMETVPKFFNVLYPYMPMTYSVGLLKEITSSFSTATAWRNASVLIGIFVAFTLLTLLFSATRRAGVKVRAMLQAQE